MPTRAEAVRRVAAFAKDTPPGVWIRGRGWWQELWEGQAFPTAADLDAAAPDNPVYLTAKSGHAAWVNAMALRMAGVTAGTPDPAGGQIVRDGRGEPTGVLLENAMDLVANAIPDPTAEQIADWIEAAQARLWAAGLTGAHDFDGPRCFEALQLLHARDALGLRVLKHIQPAENLEHALAMGLRWGFGDDMLRLGGLKIFADGALGPNTALMVEPYEGQPENRGVSVTDKETMYALVSKASAGGIPSAIHAIGDRAVHDVLDVFEAVRREEQARGVAPDAMRHRIEHVQIIHPDDRRRLGQLGVIASMQPIHATGDMAPPTATGATARSGPTTGASSSTPARGSRSAPMRQSSRWSRFGGCTPPSRAARPTAGPDPTAGGQRAGSRCRRRSPPTRPARPTPPAWRTGWAGSRRVTWPTSWRWKTTRTPSSRWRCATSRSRARWLMGCGATGRSDRRAA
ncbi:MAG: amidohydrolase family protein [Anaerolineae bacterium]|nr:amidohydrolase family protein [Anaerolineae bacterium]